MKQVFYIPAIALFAFACATASAAVNPLGGGKHDSSQPIEINADSLEVLQEENKAIFTGHVVAIQGAVRLKSDQMTVYYAQKQETQAKDKKKSASAEDAGAIKKIDVQGNVFLSTPEETASGAHGVYDVAGSQILLNENVVLTRAKNTLKGSSLVYDFTTGKSKLVGGAATTTKDGATGKQRVRGLFVPEKKGEKK